MLPVFRNALGRPCPEWLSALLAPAIANTTAVPEVSVYTLHQLRFFCAATGEGVVRYNLLLDPAPREPEQLALRAALAHSRPICRVHIWEGDGEAQVDIAAEFLTCRGTALTECGVDLRRLREVTAQRGYTLPFWLTESEVELLFLHSAIWCSLQLANLSLHEVHSLFAEHAVSLAEQAHPYMNLQELTDSASMNGTKFLYRAVNLFRKFKPLNVLTKKNFDQCIEDRIRIESLMSQCWCTIWGTPADFRNAGIELFEDPIGIYVMDADGNESFIINALSTKDPLGAFCRVYSDHFIHIV